MTKDIKFLTKNLDLSSVISYQDQTFKLSDAIAIASNLAKPSSTSEEDKVIFTANILLNYIIW